MTDTAESNRFSVAYLVAPATAVLVAIPAAILVSPFHIPEDHTGRVLFVVAAIPLPLGVLSCPGYVYVWTERWRRRHLGGWRKAWLHGSMAAAAVASLMGGLLMLGGMLVVAAFPLLSGVLALHMWVRFVRVSSGR